MSLDLAIVGGGPMCTYALERLAALLPATDLPDGLSISVFERSGRFGAGASHSDLQPPTSYMNRIADQIALAADESNCHPSRLLPKADRPTFAEWCNSVYARTADERFHLHPRDVPRRYLHGMALCAACARYVALLREVKGVTVDLHALTVTQVRRGDGVAPYRIDTAGSRGAPFPADRILFVTGHSRNRPDPVTARLARHGARRPPSRFVPHPYPLESALTPRAVPPGASVGVLGLGLTAIDVFLHLTEGRGGSFASAGQPGAGARLEYRPSGREPASIVGIGPSGMLPTCRPDNFKAAGAGLEHDGVFFTAAAVRTLRRAHGRPATLPDGSEVRQLDFDRHLLPLVVLEMAYVYYRALLGERFAAAARDAVEGRYRRFLEATRDPRDVAVDHLLEPVQALYDEAVTADGGGGWRDRRFDWRSILDPLAREDAADGESWQDRAIAFMRADNANAAEGNLTNPTKAACDGVWRDLRPVLCDAADRGGLTAESQRRFMATHMRHYNRLSNGAGLEAMAKVLALAESGLLDMSVGPRPIVEPASGRLPFRVRGPVTGAVRELDVLVEGRMHSFDAERDAGSLYPSLLRSGLARRWRNPGRSPEEHFLPGGLDLTPDLHPIGRDGTVDRRLTFVGAPTEGVMFFQLSVARPRSNSYVLNHLGNWAGELVESIGAPALEATG